MANIHYLWKFTCTPLYPVCTGEIIAAFPKTMRQPEVVERMQEIAEDYGMGERDDDRIYFVGEVDLDVTDQSGWDDWGNKILTIQNGNY